MENTFMGHPGPGDWSRREFLARATLTGAAALLGFPPRPVEAEPPPETTRLTLAPTSDSICQGPVLVAEALLRSEGFTDLRYLKGERTVDKERAVASGEADIISHFAAPVILRIDQGDPVVILAGAHVGCFELFGTERIRAIRDLKGKTVSILALGSTEHTFLSSIVAYVGLDPRQDINWVTHPPQEAIRLLAEEQIDALLGLPPTAQQLRARKIGHVVLNSAVDRPWSQYFCCMLVGNRDFVRKNPVATKRALRALLKANDICAAEPERVAKFLSGQAFMPGYDYTLQALKELPFARWRETDPEDTIRFYALRLNEIGMIKATPQKIIEQSTDWRFLNQLRKELKA